MQRTRDKVGLHGQALGREPLIFAVRPVQYLSEVRFPNGTWRVADVLGMSLTESGG